MLIVLGVVDLALWLSVFSPATDPAIYFLDIGQGDSSLVVLEGGVKILIDGGPDAAVVERLAEVLPPHDRYLDLVVMTHTDLDHMGGLIDVLQTYKVGTFIGTGRKDDSDEYRELINALIEQQVPYAQLAEGDEINIGDTRLAVLSPNTQEVLSSEPNDAGLVFRLTSPNYSALFTADISTVVEGRLAKEYNLQSDILKVGHHGSKFSSSAEFLSGVSPRLAGIGVGKNRYGHPAPDALERIAKITRHIFRTDEQGTIKIVRNDNQLKVFAENKN